MEKELKIGETKGVELTTLQNNQEPEPTSVISTEEDLQDHPQLASDTDDSSHAEVDYSTFAKKDFVSLIKELAGKENFKKTDSILHIIKPLFNSIRNKAKKEALSAFIKEGGTKESFDFRKDDLDLEFDANVKLIKDRKTKYFKEQEAQRSQNLQKKEEILEKLRKLLDEEDSEHNFKTFKDIQNEWKEVGPVAAAYARGLWANYNALIDRFYDHRSIYFELKELDRKKNLEYKIELCVKAEELDKIERLNDAIRQLNELHHEFKHIGPVPIEDKDSLWERFKAASDAVYKKRDAHVKSIQEELNKHLALKMPLLNKIKIFGEFKTDKIKLWNEKTKEILELQKKWEAIGGVPRNKSKDINKQFWTSFKTFFANKSQFFKKLDEERSANLKLKDELIEQVNKLKESQEWESTSNELIQLQKKWKEIGPVPGKMREKKYKEFKTACDYFFDQRRKQQEQEGTNQIANLDNKKAICIEMLSLAEQKNSSVEGFREFQTKFNAVGFVPRDEVGSIKSEYQQAASKYISSINDLSSEKRDRLMVELQLEELRQGPGGERKIIQKEHDIRRKITKIEHDIALLRNNLEFFGRSKNAEKYKVEFKHKITQASDHLKELKTQLKILNTVS